MKPDWKWLVIGLALGVVLSSRVRSIVPIPTI